MKKIVFLLFLTTVSLFSQEKKIPEGWDKITLEGKVAYMNLVTGDVSTTFPKTAAIKKEIVPEFDPTIIHYVKKGETLSTIARTYNKTLAALYRLNSLVDFDKIEIGDEVVIGYQPEEKKEVPPTNVKYHTVIPGETLYRIATKYGLSVQKLKELNSLTTNSISVGQQLIIN